LNSSSLPLLQRAKRQRLPGSLLLGVLLLFAAAFAWGFWWEPQRLVVTRAELKLPGLPRELSGLRVALLSDLHVGSPFWDLPALARLVERTNAEKPDLVLLAGDYQINDVPGGVFVEAEAIAEGLSHLRAPLGVHAVLGNHDWWNDGERTRRAFEQHGIHVLEESAQQLSHAGATFYVVGLADQMTRPSSPKTAFAGVPAGAPTLCLVHEPDVFESFPRLDLSPTLTLAGHTHGGQVWLPLLGRRVVPSAYGERYAYGHVVENGRHLFVTSGVGTSILPVRFFVPPEIALLTLR
jgi:predicted MPP superfamily phosphohydrolase